MWFGPRHAANGVNKCVGCHLKRPSKSCIPAPSPLPFRWNEVPSPSEVPRLIFAGGDKAWDRNTHINLYMYIYGGIHMYIYEEVLSLALLVFISSYMALISLCQRRSRGGEDLQASRFEQLLACLSYAISSTLSFFPSLSLYVLYSPLTSWPPCARPCNVRSMCAHVFLFLQQHLKCSGMFSIKMNHILNL